MARIICLLLMLVGLSLQKDPLNDFCRRWGHQTAVIDQKLYIDGGAVNWNPISQNPGNNTNQFLLYNDLTNSPVNVGVPQLYANLSKNATMPIVQGGVLWPDEVNKRFYLYGGDFFDGDTPGAPTLLSYDVIYNQWESFGAPVGINSVSWGGAVGVSELGQGYIYGGWASNASVLGWNGGPLATSYLLKYQMDSGVWSNLTGPDTTPRAEGVMVYIPASSSGLLVYFGGLQLPYGNSTTTSSPMKTIYIYDIASSKWYSQQAVGDIPGDRRRFCAGAGWAQDQSSYNVYLYGGLGFNTNYTGYDDVYILSIPSFTWVKMWEGSGAGNPHNTLTCNVVNSGQMIVIGGTFPTNDNCDSPPTWGTHNLDLGQGWQPYAPNITSYSVPDVVVSAIGGSAQGGATATAPPGGYNNQDLGVYFSERATVAARTPTRAIPTPTPANTTTTTPTPIPHKSALSTGAIIGIAIVGAVLLLVLLIGGCCLYRRRRATPKTLSGGTPTTMNGTLDYSYMPQSPHSHSHSQHSHSHSQHSPRSQHAPLGPGAGYFQTERYQLGGDCVPAELVGSPEGVPSANYQGLDPKEVMMQQIQTVEREHPAYHTARWVEVQPPSPSPIASSVAERGEFAVYSPVSEGNRTPTGTGSPRERYARTMPGYEAQRSERRDRRPVKGNQTFYTG